MSVQISNDLKIVVYTSKCQR